MTDSIPLDKILWKTCSSNMRKVVEYYVKKRAPPYE